MVQMYDNIVGLDFVIFMYFKIWKVFGYVDVFNDLLIDNKDSKCCFWVDVFIEEYMEKIEGKIDKEIIKVCKCFGDDFDEVMYWEINLCVFGYVKELLEIEVCLGVVMFNSDLADLK